MSKVSRTLRSMGASDVQQYARDGVSFDASEFRGRVGAVDVGRLDEEWAPRYREHQVRVVYSVLSFATPIAWLLPEGWVIVTQKWGPRTSRHQGICRQLQPQVEVEAVVR